MKEYTTTIASVFTALFASIFCIGPLVLALIGVSGVGFFSVFEEYRTSLIIATFGLLGTGFYFTYRKKPAMYQCEPGSECAVDESKTNRLTKVILWIATGLVILFVAFPYILPYIY
jgi:hypothetical protein